jgi:ferric iron reductase protein FhuF
VRADRAAEPAPTPSWRVAEELLRDRAELERCIRAYGENLGATQLPIAAAVAFKAYAWAVIQPAVVGWLEERRVVDYSAQNLLVDFAPDGARLRLRSPRVTVLAGDARAGEEANRDGVATAGRHRPARSSGETAPADLDASTQVTIVDSEARLLHALRKTLIQRHLSLAVEAFREVRGGSSRPLWGSATQLLALPATVTDPARFPDRRRLAEQLLGLLPECLAELVHFAEIHDEDGWRPLLLRRTCCYAYTLPDMSSCITCCLLTDAQRSALTASYDMQWRRTPEPSAN